jgi:hypothetical protein
LIKDWIFSSGKNVEGIVEIWGFHLVSEVRVYSIIDLYSENWDSILLIADANF